ncbi:MAG: response regulator transcription factor [Pirellulaceae bacterium]
MRPFECCDLTFFPARDIQVTVVEQDHTQTPPTGDRLVENFRIAVVDDDAELAISFAKILQHYGHEAKVYSGPDPFLADLESGIQFDLALLDEFIGEQRGLAAFKRTRALECCFPAIMVTGNASTELTMQAMEAGFKYIFAKPVEASNLVSRVEQHCAEYRANAMFLERQAEQLRILASLSAREREVLTRMSHGKLNKQVAVELKVGLRTVETYRGRVMTKIKAESLADAVAFAIAVGLREPGSQTG